MNLATSLVAIDSCHLRRRQIGLSMSVLSYARASAGGHLGKVRILLADDHLDSLETIERHLEPEFEVVGKVLDGRLLLEEAMRLKPDVIVSDISMPLLNGMEAADQLKESGCQSRIVFLTVHSDPDFVRACFATGALGYVVKSRMMTELVPAIREALAGHIFISNHLAGRYN
jgi:DNA-binding NarL/FixJ family response regulator